MASRISPAVYALTLYLVSVGLAAMAGYRMTIPFAAFQLLDVDWLRDGLAESLLNLHAQPPLLNFALGVALKLAATLGCRVETLLLLGHVVFGAGAVLALAGLAHELLGRGPRTYVVLTIILVNPFFYASLFQYFYTIHEWCLLVGIGFFSVRFLKTGRTRAFAGALLLVVVLVNLHSLFHVAWALTLVIALLLLAPRPVSADRADSRLVRRRALCASAALLASLAWPVKNLVKFGFFGSSSWVGINFARDLVNAYPRVMAPFLGYPSTPEVERELAAFVPAGCRTVPALATLRKSDSSMNWNHFAILSLSREMGMRAVQRVGAQPSSLLVKAARNYIRGYAVYEGRHPYTGVLEPVAVGPFSHVWLRAYELLFFQYLGENTVREPFSGFAFVFPILFMISVAQVVRRGRERREEAKAVASLLFTIAWVLAMVLFVDGREGNRMRFSTEPFLVIAVFWACGGAIAPGHALDREHSA